MFICCEKQLKIFKENSYNLENISDIKFESVRCICNTCNKKIICNCICEKCYKSLDEGKFELCRNIYSIPINNILELDKKKKIVNKIFSHYKMYGEFTNNLIPYLNKYTNLYDAYYKVKKKNKNINAIKKCFTPFFCFGILYFLHNKKKFICNDCIEK